MEKHHKFSIWYVLIGVWIVLLIQNLISTFFAIKMIPYIQFLTLLKQNKVTEVAITANQIQGKFEMDEGAKNNIQSLYHFFERKRTS